MDSQPDKIHCPNCACPTQEPNGADLMPEYVAARKAKGGVSVYMTYGGTFRVKEDSPGGDLVKGLYRRYQCRVCQLPLVLEVNENEE